MRLPPHVVAGVAFVATALVATLVAVQHRLPYEFGGIGSPDEVARDSLTRGTGLSPPLVTLVVYAAALGLSARRGRVAAGALVVLVLLSGLFFGAGLAEPALRGAAVGRGGWDVVAVTYVGVGTLIATAALAVVEARRRFKEARRWS